MTVTCPDGHVSVATDYCDTCGQPLAAEPVPDPTDLVDLEDPPAALPADGARVEACPSCGAVRVGADAFCEECGYDFVHGTGGASPAAATETTTAQWEIVVTADRVQYDARDAGTIAFPDRFPPRRYAFDDDTVSVGRRSERRKLAPEIDLSVPPEDTGVSHRHAVIRRTDDGGFTVTDLGSTNGTSVNDGPTLPRDTPVRVSPGDRIQVGAWTTLTIESRPTRMTPANTRRSGDVGVTRPTAPRGWAARPTRDRSARRRAARAASRGGATAVR
jgi:hypothetical protein